MSVQSLGRFSVQVRLLGGDFDGQLRTIPRIKLQSTDQQLSFTLSRKQFPLTLSFAMTINKSQGQSFEAVGWICGHLSFLTVSSMLRLHGLPQR